MIGVSSSTIRFWEQRIPILRPQIKSGIRHYSKDNIELLKTMHRLIKQEKYTIEGAKQCISNNSFDEHNIHQNNDLVSLKNLLLKIKKNIIMK